jgi:hypothetical protein
MFVDVGPDNRQISGAPPPSSLLTIVVLLFATKALAELAIGAGLVFATSALQPHAVPTRALGP